MKKSKKSTSLVYSTESGRMCPGCNSPIDDCQCRKNQQAAVTADGVVRLMYQTKGRKGKGVTLISGVPLVGSELKKLAKSLKQKCGSGGSIKNGIIEIQGEHRDALEKELVRLDYRVKRAGG
ncbi:MAG: translation initiation factor Sui1 [Thermodesulfobacteriota bacterium]